MAAEARKKKEDQLAELKNLHGDGTGENTGDAGGDPLANVDASIDIEGMPDCRLKYKIILKRAKVG